MTRIPDERHRPDLPLMIRMWPLYTQHCPRKRRRFCKFPMQGCACLGKAPCLFRYLNFILDFGSEGLVPSLTPRTSCRPSHCHRCHFSVRKLPIFKPDRNANGRTVSFSLCWDGISPHLNLDNNMICNSFLPPVRFVLLG